MIWGLAVPLKVCVFIWRLCSGALPTAVGLHRRIDSIPPWCNRCERLEESSIHAIWECRFIAGVWDYEELSCMWECPKVENGCDWVNWWLTNLKRDEASKVAMVTWTCCNERNAVCHGKQKRLPREMVVAATSALKAYSEAREGKDGVWGGKDIMGRTQ